MGGLDGRVGGETGKKGSKRLLRNRTRFPETAKSGTLTTLTDTVGRCLLVTLCIAHDAGKLQITLETLLKDPTQFSECFGSRWEFCPSFSDRFEVRKSRGPTRCQRGRSRPAGGLDRPHAHAVAGPLHLGRGRPTATLATSNFTNRPGRRPASQNRPLSDWPTVRRVKSCQRRAETPMVRNTWRTWLSQS